jgi:hypothetical protein
MRDMLQEPGWCSSAVRGVHVDTDSHVGVMLIRLHLIEVFSITLAESIVGIELELGRLDGVDATVQGRAERVATTGTTDRNVANNGTSRVHGVVEKSYATGPAPARSVCTEVLRLSRTVQINSFTG